MEISRSQATASEREALQFGHAYSSMEIKIGAALGSDADAKLDPDIRPKAKSALTEITTALDKLNQLEKRKKR
jgi:hypothetical protein